MIPGLVTALSKLFGVPTEARSTATDTTAATPMQVLKEISYMAQNPASQAVTNAGTFAVQATLAAETTKLIGTTVGYSNASAPSSSQTRPDNTTAYDAGDIVGTDPAANMTFSNVLPVAGALFTILAVSLEIDVAAIPSGMSNFRLHLFDAAPTAIADGTAWALADADRAKYLGYITLNAPTDEGGTIWSQTDSVNFTRKLAAGATALYGMLQTVAGFTPSAQTVKKVTLTVAGV